MREGKSAQPRPSDFGGTKGRIEMETPQLAADSSARRCSAPDSTGRIPAGFSCIYSRDCEL